MIKKIYNKFFNLLHKFKYFFLFKKNTIKLLLIIKYAKMWIFFILILSLYLHGFNRNTRKCKSLIDLYINFIFLIIYFI